MSQTVSIILSAEDRERLAAIIGDRNRRQKHVQRARIIFHSDREPSVTAVSRLAEASRPAAWRWQQRFAEEGIDGLLRDKTRPPGKTPLPPETVAKILALPCTEPPGEATHWTGRTVANHPRWVFHFTPTSASWINAVENFFSVITRRRLKRGVFNPYSPNDAGLW